MLGGTTCCERQSHFKSVHSKRLASTNSCVATSVVQLSQQTTIYQGGFPLSHIAYSTCTRHVLLSCDCTVLGGDATIYWIAQSHTDSSLSVTTCGPLAGVPLPLISVVCSWLACVDLLTSASTALVALHHRLPDKTPSSSASSSSHASANQSNWVAAAWYHACLSIEATFIKLHVKQFKRARRRKSDAAFRWAQLFPDTDDQPARLCRLILAATPHLRHLRIHLDTQAFGHMPDMADTLDMTPAIHSLVLSAEADDCTGQKQLYIPLPEVLKRHPRLHALHCDGSATGSLDLSVSDILAIGTHPALAHIDVSGTLHYWTMSQTDLMFSHPRQTDMRLPNQTTPELCPGCTSTSTNARHYLLRHVQECMGDEEQNDEFMHSDFGMQSTNWPTSCRTVRSSSGERDIHSAMTKNNWQLHRPCWWDVWCE